MNSSIKPNIDMSDIEPRGKQIIYPIAIVFNHKQEILNSLSEITLERQGDLIKERSTTYDGIIVNAYLELIDKGYKYITPTDIEDLVKNRGYEKATTRSIGHHMRSLGFKNSVKNINGNSKRCYSCDEELLEKLRKRYSLQSIKTKTEEPKLQRLQTLQKYRGWKGIFNRIKGKTK